MATAVATQQSPSALRQRVQSLKSSLSNLREAAVVATRRLSIVAIAAPTAYGVGRLEGWAKRTGKSIVIPKTKVKWTLAGGIGAALFGALGTKVAGEQLADAVLGLGAGAIDGTLAVQGYEAGLVP